MRNFLPALLLLFPFSLQAQSWKRDLEEFSPARILPAPNGHLILESPGGTTLKRISQPEKMSAKAAVTTDGKTYYMSDWSWERYQEGKRPNWIYIIPSESEVTKAVEVVAEAAAVSAPIETPEPESLNLIERLERRFGGHIDVFSSEVDIPAPKGHKIFSAPRDGRLLKSTDRETTFGAKAEITLDSGEVYYASTWSWNQTLNGSNATWTHLNGRVSKLFSPPPKLEGEKEDSGIAPKPETPRQSTGLVMSASGPPRVVALLIANSAYSSVTPGQTHLDLQTTENDANLLAATLHNSGAEVRLVTNADHDQILAAVDESIETLGNRDVFLLYYSGHALQMGRKNYLAPLGISFMDKEAVLKTAVKVDDVIERITRKNPRLAALFLDGSRRNPFNHADPSTHLLLRIPGLNLGGKVVLTQPGLATEPPPENVIMVLPAKPGEFAVSGTRSGKYSYFAAALASAFEKNMEIHDALALAGKLVTDWSQGNQEPWISTSETAPFYLQTPGLRSTTPDRDTLRAAQWLTDEGENGIPMAMAHLAKSVRANPDDNPATAALLFLLGHQSVAVPVNTWGPFDVGTQTFSPDIQVSLDGLQIALFPENDPENPVLIVDRESGKSLQKISGIFSPAYSTAEVKTLPPHWNSETIATVTTVQQIPEVIGPPQLTVTPILTGDPVVGTFFDEGLERLYLATRRKDGKIEIREFATTPAVKPNPKFAKTPATIDLKPGENRILAEGAVASTDQQSWQLVFDGASQELRLILDGKTVYSRGNAAHPRTGLEDWSMDERGESLILLYRNQATAITVAGRRLGSFQLPTTQDRRTILSFSPSFRRLTLAQGEVPGARIGVYNLATGRELGMERPRQGYREFASLSPNHEWFFHYDESGRWHMADSLTGGKLLDFRGISTLSPIRAIPQAEEDDEFSSMPLEIEHPPFHEEFANYVQAPEWLPELTESLLGFSLGENSEPEWHEDSPQRVRSAARPLGSSRKNQPYPLWRDWLEQNRLAAIQN